MEFDPSPADVIETAVVFSSTSSSCCTPDDGVWDENDDYASTNTSLSSLSDSLFEGLEAREDYYSPYSTLLETTAVDLSGDVDPWDVDADDDTGPVLLDFLRRTSAHPVWTLFHQIYLPP
jgi:hypothetical protein